MADYNNDYTNKLHAYTKTLDSKMGQRVFKVLDKDVLTVMVNDKKEFIIEPTGSSSSIPDFAYKWIGKEMVKRGFTSPYFDKKGNYTIFSRNQSVR